jgi:hypothetical protein
LRGKRGALAGAAALLPLLLLAGCISAGWLPPRPDPSRAEEQRRFIAEEFAGTDVRRGPESLAAFRGGARATVSAAWWGFDPADSTGALQAALDSGARVVLVPAMESPWVTRPLVVRSGTTVIFQEGAVLEAQEGGFRDIGACLLTLVDARDVTLRGYGARLLMHKRDYRRPPYEPSEYRHAVDLSGCSDVTIEGLSIESSGGDGVYLGRGERRFCERVLLRDLVIRDNHRQAISVISAQDLTVENVEMSYTEGNLPSAGIDFEPNYADERFVRVLLKDCIIRGNGGPGICLALRNLGKESMPVDIRVEDCRIADNLFSLMVFGAGRAQGSLDFSRTEIRGVPMVFTDSGVKITGR